MNPKSDEPTKLPSTDCYSQSEREWMKYGQNLRASILKPLLHCLNWAGVTPDLITLMGAVVGVAFVPLVLLNHFVAAVICLFIHVLLDGIDGPLARKSGVASSRGSFTDTFADQIVVTAVVIGWILMYPASGNILSGTIFVFLYTLVVAMSMVRNALSIPYAWLVRPRFLIYFSISIDLLASQSWTFYFLCFANALLALKTVSGFWKLRHRLPGPENHVRKSAV